jgi:hypothetical protein
MYAGEIQADYAAHAHRLVQAAHKTHFSHNKMECDQLRSQATSEEERLSRFSKLVKRFADSLISDVLVHQDEFKPDSEQDTLCFWTAVEAAIIVRVDHLASEISIRSEDRLKIISDIQDRFENLDW